MSSVITVTYLLSSYLLVNIFLSRILSQRDCIKHPAQISFAFQSVSVIIWCSVFGTKFSSGFSVLVNSLLLICCIFFYNGSILLKLCAFFISCFILTLGEIVAGSPFLLLNAIFPGADLIPKSFNQDGRNGLAVTMFLLDFLFLLFVFGKLGRLLENHFMFLKPLLLLKLGGPLAVLVFLQALFYSSNTVQGFLYLALPFWITVFVCLYILKLALKELEEQENLNTQLEIQKDHINRQLSYFYKTAKEYQIIHKWNHDVSNHLLALSYLIDHGDIKKAEQYIDSLFSTYGFKRDDQ